MDDLVEQTLEESHHGEDEVDVRGLDEVAAVVAHEVEAWLDEPVKHIADHLHIVLVDVWRELVLHVGLVERLPT